MEVVTLGLTVENKNPSLVTNDAFLELQVLVDKTMTAQKMCAITEPCVYFKKAPKVHVYQEA